MQNNQVASSSATVARAKGFTTTSSSSSATACPPVKVGRSEDDNIFESSYSSSLQRLLSFMTNIKDHTLLSLLSTNIHDLLETRPRYSDPDLWLGDYLTTILCDVIKPPKMLVIYCLHILMLYSFTYTTPTYIIPIIVILLSTFSKAMPLFSSVVPAVLLASTDFTALVILTFIDPIIIAYLYNAIYAFIVYTVQTIVAAITYNKVNKYKPQMRTIIDFSVRIFTELSTFLIGSRAQMDVVALLIRISVAWAQNFAFSYDRIRERIINRNLGSFHEIFYYDITEAQGMNDVKNHFDIFNRVASFCKHIYSLQAFISYLIYKTKGALGPQVVPFTAVYPKHTLFIDMITYFEKITKKELGAFNRLQFHFYTFQELLSDIQSKKHDFHDPEMNRDFHSLCNRASRVISRLQGFTSTKPKTSLETTAIVLTGISRIGKSYTLNPAFCRLFASGLYKNYNYQRNNGNLATSNGWQNRLNDYDVTAVGDDIWQGNTTVSSDDNNKPWFHACQMFKTSDKFNINKPVLEEKGQVSNLILALYTFNFLPMPAHVSDQALPAICNRLNIAKVVPRSEIMSLHAGQELPEIDNFDLWYANLTDEQLSSYFRLDIKKMDAYIEKQRAILGARFDREGMWDEFLLGNDADMSREDMLDDFLKLDCYMYTIDHPNCAFSEEVEGLPPLVTKVRTTDAGAFVKRESRFFDCFELFAHLKGKSRAQLKQIDIKKDLFNEEILRIESIDMTMADFDRRMAESQATQDLAEETSSVCDSIKDIFVKNFKLDAQSVNCNSCDESDKVICFCTERIEIADRKLVMEDIFNVINTREEFDTMLLKIANTPLTLELQDFMELLAQVPVEYSWTFTYEDLKNYHTIVGKLCEKCDLACHCLYIPNYRSSRHTALMFLLMNPNLNAKPPVRMFQHLSWKNKFTRLCNRIGESYDRTKISDFLNFASFCGLIMVVIMLFIILKYLWKLPDKYQDFFQQTKYVPKDSASDDLEPPPDPLIPQGGGYSRLKDVPRENQATQEFSDNMCQKNLVVISPDKINIIGNALGMHGKTLVMCRHFQSMFKDKFYIRHLGEPWVEVLTADCLFDNSYYTAIGNMTNLYSISPTLIDLVDCTLPKNHCRTFRDIRGTMVSPKYLKNDIVLDDSQLLRIDRFGNKVIKHIDARTSWSQDTYQTPNGRSYMLAANLTYPCRSEPGWCGAILQGTTGVWKGKLLGIHIAGVNGKTGHSILLCNPKDVIVSQGAISTTGFEESEAGPYIRQTMKSNITQSIWYSTLKTYVKNVEGEKYQWKASSVNDDGVVYDKIKQFDKEYPTKLPVNVRGVGDKNPLESKFQKLTNNYVDLDPELLTWVDDAMKKHFLDFTPKFDEADAWTDTLYGNGTNVKSLITSTSAGLPYVEEKLTRKDMIPTREEALRGEFPAGYERIKNDVSKLIDTLPNGPLRPQVAVHLKADETLPRAKVLAGDGRAICAFGLDWLLTGKMFFKEVVAHVFDNAVPLGYAIGINPYGADWVRMEKLLRTTKSDNGLVWSDEDVAAMEYTMYSPQVVEYFINFFTWIYREDTEENNMIRTNYLRSVFNVRILYGGVWYSGMHYNPSGHYLTALLNSMVVKFWDIYTFYQIARENKFNNISCNYHNLNFAVSMGDDLIKATDAGIINWYTFKRIQEVYKTYGITKTSAEKGKPMIWKKELTECTFLKRAFANHSDGYPVGALDPESMLNSLFWCKDKNAILTTGIQNMNCQLLEASMHNEEFFNFLLGLAHERLRGESGGKALPDQLSELVTYSECLTFRSCHRLGSKTLLKEQAQLIKFGGLPDYMY